MSTLLLTTTLLLSSLSFTVFTLANSFNVLICSVEYVGACPSSDFPLGGPTRRLLFLLGVNFLFGILGVNFFLSAPLLSLVSLLSLGVKLGSLICLYHQRDICLPEIENKLVLLFWIPLSVFSRFYSLVPLLRKQAAE